MASEDQLQLPLIADKPQDPLDASWLLLWTFRVAGFAALFMCLLVDVANITAVIQYKSLNCPTHTCGYGPISAPILEVANDLCACLLSLMGIWFILSRYSIRPLKPGISCIRAIHNRISKIGWWVVLSVAILVYMNYFVFYDNISDGAEGWLKAMEYASKSLATVFVGTFIWILHNIIVTHCLHYEGKILFATCSCLCLPQMSNVIFFVVVGVVQANSVDPAVAASWIFFFMLAALSSLLFTYLLKPSKIEEWRTMLRMVQQVTTMNDYTPRFQKRRSLSLPYAPPLMAAPPVAPVNNDNILAHSLPTHFIGDRPARRPSLVEHHHRRGSVDDSVLDAHGDVILDPVLAARTVAEEAVHKAEELAYDMRMLKASTVFSRPVEHTEDKERGDQLKKDVARLEDTLNAQVRKVARLEAQLKESEGRQQQALRNVQTEAQTSVTEMTEQLEKLEAFVVSTSKMVSEVVKPKDS